MNTAVIIEEKLRKLGKFEGARINTVSGKITSWEGVVGVPQPDEATLSAWEQELIADKTDELQFRKSRKQAIRQKLGLTKAEIKHLKELLEDGDDD